MFPGDVVQCTEAYLESLMCRIQDVKLQVLRFGCGAPPLDMKPGAETQDHLFQALSEIQQLTPHIQRLVAHPELFGDVRRLHKFFTQAVEVFDAARRFTRLVKSMRLAQDEAKENFWQLRSTHPSTANGKEVPAWYTWCAPRKTADGMPVVVPGLMSKFVADEAIHHGATKILPPQGVLIAEHYKNHIAKLVDTIVATCPNHAKAKAQYPHRADMMNGEGSNPVIPEDPSMLVRQQIPHTIPGTPQASTGECQLTIKKQTLTLIRPPQTDSRWDQKIRWLRLPA